MHPNFPIPGAVDVIRIEVNGAIWQLIALFLLRHFLDMDTMDLEQTPG